MKEKITKKFSAMSKDVTVGTRRKNYFIIDPPTSKNKKKTASVTIRPTKSKQRKCSGCSRRRPNKRA